MWTGNLKTTSGRPELDVTLCFVTFDNNIVYVACNSPLYLMYLFEGGIKSL